MKKGLLLVHLYPNHLARSNDLINKTKKTIKKWKKCKTNIRWKAILNLGSGKIQAIAIRTFLMMTNNHYFVKIIRSSLPMLK